MLVSQPKTSLSRLRMTRVLLTSPLILTIYRCALPFHKQNLLANEPHKSQFFREEVKKDHQFTEKLFGGYVWFRLWFGGIKGDDLFR